MTRRRRVALGGFLAALALPGIWLAVPPAPALLAPPAQPGVRLEDRTGAVLRSTRASDGSRLAWRPLEAIDPDLVAAFVLLEDRRFHEHHGIDLRAVARAARDNLAAGRVVSGASTIPMQLARLLTGAPRTFWGKARQAAWALRLDAHLGKHVLLEQYLNRVPLGEGAVGVEAAAQLYFGASAADLGAGQAALLAALARAPSSDNPLVAPARARRRRDEALGRLVAAGYLRPDEARAAAGEPLLGSGREAPFLAPHFTTQAAARARREGPSRGTVRTTLDATLQRALEAEVAHAVRGLADRGARHAALVVLDNASGGILAWVGSPDFWADSAGQVDMVTSARQPGSALKPFVYGLAFERGFTAASVLPDLARTYAAGTGSYAPRNYDRRFHGPVRAREALASSFNVPAVELAHRLGVSAVLATLRDAGFASLRRSADHYGLGLALGNGDVTLLELANAYRALANGGEWRPVTWRLGEPAAPGRRVLSPAAAALVLDILGDAEARIAGFGTVTPLEFPFPAAAKTGTSRHFTDNWAVAVTGGFSVAVWVGDFTGRPMAGVSGVSGAGPLLQRAVLLTAARHAPGRLRAPADEGARRVRICRTSGQRAGARCPPADEWFLPGTQPADTCGWHDATGLRLPAEYAAWAAQEGLPPAGASPPDAHDVAGPPDDRLRILSPADGDRYRVPPGVEATYATIALRAAGAGGRAVRWEVDGRPVRGARWRLAPGAHRVRAIAGREAAEARFVVD